MCLYSRRCCHCLVSSHYLFFFFFVFYIPHPQSISVGIGSINTSKSLHPEYQALPQKHTKRYKISSLRSEQWWGGTHTPHPRWQGRISPALWPCLPQPPPCRSGGVLLVGLFLNTFLSMCWHRPAPQTAPAHPTHSDQQQVRNSAPEELSLEDKSASKDNSLRDDHNLFRQRHAGSPLMGRLS